MLQRSTAALGQSDCYQDNNKLFHSDRQERKKKRMTKLQQGLQTSGGEEYGYTYSIFGKVESSMRNRLAGRVKKTTGKKLYKQYLDTLIEVKRF